VIRSARSFGNAAELARIACSMRHTSTAVIGVTVGTKVKRQEPLDIKYFIGRLHVRMAPHNFFEPKSCCLLLASRQRWHK
jgi:hypothetical protein